MKKAFFLILTAFIIQSCTNMTQKSLPGSEEIILTWEFSGNHIAENLYESKLTIENQSAHTLDDEGWVLYFSQMGSSAAHMNEAGHVKVEHINGDLFRIEPGEDFSLEPGKSITITLRKSGRLIKEVEAPLGPYFVFQDPEGVVGVENYTIKPFPSLEKIYPSETGLPLPSAEWSYDQNKFQEVLPGETLQIFVPSPADLSYGDQKVRFSEGLIIQAGEGLEGEARFLAKLLQQIMGFEPSVVTGEDRGPNIIQLIQDHELDKSGHEAYTLNATADGGVIISGATASGVFYGIQSLLSMLPVHAWKDPQLNIEISSVNITDSPAFEYRGMHLDLSRNFVDPADIRKLIKAMSFYKLNKLHLHLTDDEGWRIEISALPELTDVGSYRGHTESNKDHLNPAYGSGPEPDPEVGHGSGYLTREEFMGILKFADEHHIEVIPEVNFPGHSRAAIYAMEARYDRLMKAGKEEEALKYRLIDPDDESRFLSAQNYHDNVVCVCMEAPYLFYETVVDELIGMYEEAGLTLNILHAGGDEVPANAWDGSPICLAFIEGHPEIGGTVNLQAYFEGRLFEILKKKNLVMGGWEEIAMKKDENGRWIPNPEFAGQAMLPYVWNSRDDYLDLGNRLANADYPLILCNVTNFYFDLAYNHHPSEPGHYWGGYVNTRTAFEFAPYNVFASTITNEYGIPFNPDTDFRGMEKLKPEAYKNILGIQGELWSETLKGSSMMEYYYMPKLIGLAERAWSGQDDWASVSELDQRVNAIQKAWNKFANAVGQREMPRLDYLFGGFNYRLPPPGGIIQDGHLYANTDFPGLPIRYTTDGTEPGMDSPLYTGPVEVQGEVKLRSFDTRGRGSRISIAK